MIRYTSSQDTLVHIQSVNFTSQIILLAPVSSTDTIYTIASPDSQNKSMWTTDLPTAFTLSNSTMLWYREDTACGIVPALQDVFYTILFITHFVTYHI